jgi:hypothetical protein
MLAASIVFTQDTVDAAPVYCAAQPATGLDETDVFFRNLASDDCYGVVTNPNNPSANGAANTWTVNTLDGGLFGGGWEAFVKDDGSDGTLTNYRGINWTLSAPQNVTSGSWTLSLSDPPPVSLPVSVDMMTVLKASDRWAAYLFTAETFVVTGSNSGTFEIAFVNKGGNIPGLSGMSLYFRGAPTTQVPEPGTLASLFMGAGLLLARVRQRSGNGKSA